MKNTTFEVQAAYRTHPLSFIDAPDVFTKLVNGIRFIYPNIHFLSRYNEAVQLNNSNGEKAQSSELQKENMEKYDNARYVIPNFDEDYDEEQQHEIVLILSSRKKERDDIEFNPEIYDYEAELADSNYKAYKLSLKRKS